MITKLYYQNPDFKLIEELTHHIDEGEIIIFPTGMGYAYGCNPLKVTAVERIYALKRSDMRKQLFALMCRDLAEASSYAKIDNSAFRFIKEHLSEPMTFILPVTNKLPKQLKERKEVGIRFSLSPITSLLLEHLSYPLLTASLPVLQEEIEYLTNPELIDELYGKEVYTILDGDIAPGLQTAVIRIEGDSITELRPHGPIVL